MSLKLCADAIMRNNPLNTSSSEEIYQQYGGAADKPNGGFPPIVMCKQKTKVVDEKVKSVKGKNIVSLQEIMEKRRDFSPFLPNTK